MAAFGQLPFQVATSDGGFPCASFFDLQFDLIRFMGRYRYWCGVASLWGSHPTTGVGKDDTANRWWMDIADFMYFDV